MIESDDSDQEKEKEKEKEEEKKLESDSDSDDVEAALKEIDEEEKGLIGNGIEGMIYVPLEPCKISKRKFLDDSNDSKKPETLNDEVKEFSSSSESENQGKISFFDKL